MHSTHSRLASSQCKTTTRDTQLGQVLLSPSVLFVKMSCPKKCFNASGIVTLVHVITNHLTSLNDNAILFEFNILVIIIFCSKEGKKLIKHLFSQQEGSHPKECAAASPDPCILKEGSLKSPGNVYLCADKQVLCSANCTLLKATVGLMSVFYIFLYQYPPGLRKFFICICKNVYFTSKMAKNVHQP